MSKSLIEHLVECNDAELKCLWISINEWEWPNCLPIRFKPAWWDGIPHIPSLTKGDIRERKYAFGQLIRDYIETRITPDEIRARKEPLNTWEYRTEYLRADEGEMNEYALSKLGGDGWELAYVHDGAFCVFKRPIQ